ncbi:EAL domain-containing protein [Halomonas sp. BLK-85]
MPHLPETDDSPALSSRRLRRRALGIYTVSLILMAAILTGLLLDQYQQEMRNSKERNASRASLVAEWIQTTFALSDHGLKDIELLLGPPLKISVDDTFLLETLLMARADSRPLISEISIINRHGRVLASTRSVYPPGYDLSRMTFYRHLKEGADTDYVGPLFWSAFDRAYRVVHARALFDSSKSFNGAVVVQLMPEVFSQALQHLNTRQGESIAIMDTQGRLLARRPDAKFELGMATANNPEVAAFLESHDQQRAMRFHSPVDGEERLYWMERLEGLPFNVVVGERTENVLAGWKQRLWILTLIASMIALLGAWVVRHYCNRLYLAEQLRHRIEEREEAKAQAQMREARLEALVQSIQDMIFVFDQYGCFTYIHALDEDWLLEDKQTVLGRHYSDVMPPEVTEALNSVFYRVQHNRQVEELEYSLPRAEDVRHFHAVLSPLADAGGGFNGVLAAVRDVTESHLKEAELRIAATAFQTHLGILITDRQARIIKVNDTFSRITGYREDEVLGENPRMFSSGRHSDDFYKFLWSSVAEKGSWEGEIWNRRKNGQIFPEWLTISAVKDGQGNLTHYVATLNDITERKAAEQEIHQLAFFDPLTGLANRRLFIDRMEAVLKTHERHNKLGALLFIDLDNFKQVNDTLGHYAGDKLLQSMALELAAVLRDTDTLARLGGDEFAVLIEGLGAHREQTAELAENIALKLLMAIRRPIEVDDDTVLVTGSIGITLLEGADHDVDICLQQADMALFQAKEAGRDTLSFFDPQMQAALLARARLENDMRLALANEQWTLLYQPQVDANGMLTGVEALLRWQHPERGMVSPGEFIPLLESTRLINEVGDWVLETACRQLAEWQKKPQTAGLSMAVNISPVQFSEDSFVPKVKAILRRTGAPADKLKLEVTETLFVDVSDNALRKMSHLRHQCVRFSLDDFGTGYSSLSYLAHLPLDQLKIDQSFVRELLNSRANAAIVESIIVLAKSLGLSVIAEGVETTTQRDWLKKHGCIAYQGYLFGRPMSTAEIEKMM